MFYIFYVFVSHIMLTDDGIFAVKAARKTVECETVGKEPDIDFPKSFDAESGVFVTLNTYPARELRGCIGYPEPFYPLKDALVFSAQSACHDPRFPALDKSECSGITVEVTVLSKPELVMVDDKTKLLKKIVIGRDGLIIEFGRKRGLLLPQVPVEWNWDVEEYLENLCLKAGLPRDAWTLKDSSIYSFTGEIFSETSPNGEIVRR